MAEDRIALVLEGGGYRGIFTAGILDVLMENGFGDEFASVWGTSAGAMNAVSFKSHQIGRTMRIMLTFRDDRRFMSFMSFVRTGNLTGGDFVYEEVQNKLDPCDNDTFNANPLEMYAVASDVVFGTAGYLPVRTLPDDVPCVRASASLPLVSTMVEISGHRYLDGGTTDSIPFEAALGLYAGPWLSEGRLRPERRDPFAPLRRLSLFHRGAPHAPHSLQRSARPALAAREIGPGFRLRTRQARGGRHG